MLGERSHQSATGLFMENDPNEVELPLPRIEYQSALIKANIAVGLTFLQMGSMDDETREAAKNKAERTVEDVHRLLAAIEDRLEPTDRELIQVRLAELESALAAFNR